MPELVVIQPMPVRENLPEISEENLNGDFSRVVFDNTGQNYKSPFTPESKVYMPALFSEGATTQNLSENLPAQFNTAVQDPDDIVTTTPSSFPFKDAFVLKPGFAYRLEAQLTSRNTTQDFSGCNFRWRVNGDYIGNTGTSNSYDQSGETNQYGEHGSISAVAYVENSTTQDMEALVMVTGLAGNTDQTNKYSKAEISIIKTL
jgi:hypothetical protein